MFSTGLGILALATALLLSALQGWALRGSADGGRLQRHLLAWVVGTAVVSSVLVACWNAMAAPHALAVASLPPSALALNRLMLVVLSSVIALAVAGALGAGALHARQVDDDEYDSESAAWISRAVVQGIALFVVGGLGALALIIVAVAQVRR